jgi:hypothetical protein
MYLRREKICDSGVAWIAALRWPIDLSLRGAVILATIGPVHRYARIPRDGGTRILVDGAIWLPADRLTAAAGVNRIATFLLFKSVYQASAANSGNQSFLAVRPRIFCRA